MVILVNILNNRQNFKIWCNMINLYEALGRNKEIKKIPCGTSIQNAIKIAFSSDDYKFFLNSELIDINNRFRIFSFNNKVYITKKTTNKHENNEVSIATKVKEKIGEQVIYGRQLSVVVPDFFEVEGNHYILMNYYGQTIQENIYCKENQSEFDIQDLFSILDLLLSKGILYRGFLPRNTIIYNNKIHLIDWEDVVFSDKNKKDQVNTLWSTNFLLNWGYFFPMDVLEKKLYEYQTKTADNEPVLLKYESRIKDLMSFDDSNIFQLRNKIKALVLEAERPLDKRSSDIQSFIIHPQDMAHLISDIYDVNIDAFFDSVVYKFRKKNESLYSSFLQLTTNIILYSYKRNINIKTTAILPILFLISSDLFCIHYQKLDNMTLKAFISYWSDQKYKTNNIIQNYIYGDLNLLEQNASLLIKKIIGDSGKECRDIQACIVKTILEQCKNFKDKNYASNI